MKIIMTTHIVLSKKNEALIKLRDRLKNISLLKYIVKSSSFRAYKLERGLGM